MLKRRGLALNEQFPDWLSKLECIFASALAHVFDADIVASFRSSRDDSARLDAGLHFCTVSDAEFSLNIEMERGEADHIEEYSRLIRLLSHFHELAPGYVRAVPALRQQPQFFAVFALRSQAGMPLGNLRFASSKPLDFPGALVGNSMEPAPGPWVRLQVSVRVPSACELGIESQRFRADIEINSVPLQRSFRGRLASQGRNIQLFVEKEGVGMEDKLEEKLPVTLSLGEIELTLDELLRLRPGMCLEFERPEKFEAMLLVGGVPWTPALVHIQDREVVLEMLEGEQGKISQRREMTSNFCPETSINGVAPI